MAGIENAVHGGRGLQAWENPETGDDEAGWPEVAYESIRAINHLTSQGYAVPAPVLYDVLGNLKGVGFLMQQALTQLGEGLQASLAEYDVYDTEGEAPENVRLARQNLDLAVQAAGTLGAALETAQSTIAGQGHRTHDDEQSWVGVDGGARP